MAPLTAEIEYVFDVPEHTVALPVMVPGCAGTGFTVIVNDCIEEEPQLLLAVTVIFPLEVPAVAVIVFVVEVPVHPDGSVHV